MPIQQTQTAQHTAHERAPAPQADTDFEARFEALKELDWRGFMAELQALRSEIDAQLGPEDLAHLRKIENWGHLATALGLLTAGLGPNLLSMAGLSLGRTTRWLLMHHIGHRGYDRVPGVPKRYTSRFFGRGWRRWVDWPDWMTPESWNYEHNILHHTHTGQVADPDLLERNTEKIRHSNLPLPLRQALMLGLGLVWKPVYYAPSNIHAIHTHQAKGPQGDYTLDREGILELILDGYLPYALLQFVLLPSLFLPAGLWATYSALINSLGAELLANFHSFLVVGPNHTGDDIPRFERKPANKAERMLHQITGSVNYTCGNDLIDFLQFWLNYQIEHHIWPDLPMLRYGQVQPKVKALCEKYGVPYLQEDVFKRFGKMLDVTTGQSDMPVIR
ncbi:MAG: fatty acid desaturase [Candidatus Sericytochromatia bacterium]|nr:fatty acid desaturase [Candidatus Sericytochromatia bacterium]